VTLRWYALPLLAVRAAVVAVRARRTAATLVPVACAASVAFPYLFLIGYSAPRFLLPACALLALPVADLLVHLVRTPGRIRRPLTVALLTLALAGHLAVQVAVLEHTVQGTTAAHRDWARVAAGLHRFGVRPPCLVTGENYVPIAYYAGCSSAATGRSRCQHHGGRYPADRRPAAHCHARGIRRPPARLRPLLDPAPGGRPACVRRTRSGAGRAAVSATGVPLSRGLGRPWQLAVTSAVAVAAVWVLAAHRHSVDAGTDRLAVADRNWLLAAGAAALAAWVCAAVAQQGAVAERLPIGRLVAAEFAACAANHVLPAGVGASAVNLRFLTRCGLSTARSVTAPAVKAAVGGLVRFALAIVLLPALPRTPWLSPAVPRASLVLAIVACLAVAALVVALSRTVRHGTGRVAWRVLADVRAVHGRPSRACALWGGSLGFALLHAAVLIAVVRALDVTVSDGHVLLAYLFASGAAVLLPMPGGLDSLDAALVLTLTAAGAPGAAALSAVFGYRLLTAWLPLAPGLLVLGLLARRSVL